MLSELQYNILDLCLFTSLLFNLFAEILFKFALCFST